MLPSNTFPGIATQTSNENESSHTKPAKNSVIRTLKLSDGFENLNALKRLLSLTLEACRKNC